MIRCYLGLGSNLNSPPRQLRQAIAALRNLPSTYLLGTARIYHSEAWGRKAAPNYCNTVVALQTTLTPQQLLTQCQQIEKRQGRVRKIRNAPRTLDIDILLFGTRKLTTATLTIPHPRMHERDFVLIPLRELNLYQSTSLYLTKALSRYSACFSNADE